MDCVVFHYVLYLCMNIFLCYVHEFIHIVQCLYAVLGEVCTSMSVEYLYIMIIKVV